LTRIISILIASVDISLHCFVPGKKSRCYLNLI
jgi:hypothetical protein